MRYYDLTLPLGAATPTWPGDPTVQTEAALAVGHGDGVNVTRLTLGSHSGTHVDAPRHLFTAGAGVDTLSLAALWGPAWVTQVSAPRLIGVGDLVALGLPPTCRRLLLRTANSERGVLQSVFAREYVALSPEAARWLVAQGMLLVGLDALSVDRYDAEELPAHHILLSGGVIIVEGLELRAVPPGEYELCCLPLRLSDGDGAPARVVLRVRE
jgi:arylformamidase